MQHRWTRGRSKERLKQHTIRDGDADEFESDATDYAADNSSDHSSSATQSPRHRSAGIGGSPLARIENMREKSDSITTQQSLVMNASLDSTHPIAGNSKENDALFVSKNDQFTHATDTI